jgi:hypothetical protein
MKFKYLIFSLIIIIIVIGFIPIPLDSFTPRIEEQVIKITSGDTVRIKSIKIQLWRGISLSEVSLVSSNTTPAAFFRPL